MAQRQRPKGDYVIEIGDAQAGNGQYFDVGNKDDYDVALAAKERMRSNIERDVAAQIQGTTHRTSLSDGAEASMIRREAERRMADGRTAISAYQHALRQEIDARLKMEAANKRGIERGNLQVREKQTAEVEIER